MHITAHTSTALSAERRFIAGREVKESLSLAQGNQRLELERSSRVEVQSHSKSALRLTQDTPLISRYGLKQLEREVAPQTTFEPATEAHTLAPDEESLHKLKMLLAALGRSVDDIEAQLKHLAQGWQLPKATDLSHATQGSQDFLHYSYSETQWRGEALNVALSGSIQTQDGRTIQYGLSLEMLHMSYSHREVSIRAGAALTDPLVLNFQGPVALNGAERMDFDLNADGKKESLATLASDSAFLVLDRNHNGVIDDGRELFGAITGDGFAELAAFDEDGNGFIDEGDSIFSQLKLWRPDANGQGRLVDLVSQGVGAIGLLRAYGDFALVDHSAVEGLVRSTGVFFTEGGLVKNIQQIDLAV